MPKNSLLTRRSFVQGFVIAVAALAMGGLGACASQESTTGASSNTESNSSEGPSQGASGASESSATEPAATEATETTETTPEEPATTAAAGSVLVAYFSATGHTQKVAEAIAADLGADTFVITPAEPYTSEDINYNNSSSRVYVEHDQGGVDVELAQDTPDNWANYDTVFVGYPTWWGDASWVVRSFVQKNDFTGKTVIPFTTSASSPLGESDKTLSDAANAGVWLAGKRFSSSASEPEVTAWLREIGY